MNQEIAESLQFVVSTHQTAILQAITVVTSGAVALLIVKISIDYGIRLFEKFADMKYMHDRTEDDFYNAWLSKGYGSDFRNYGPGANPHRASFKRTE